MTTARFVHCDRCGKLRPVSAACCEPVLVEKVRDLARVERARQAAVAWKEIPAIEWEAIAELEAFLDMIDQRIETLNKRNDVPQSHIDGLRGIRKNEVARLVLARQQQQIAAT